MFLGSEKFAIIFIILYYILVNVFHSREQNKKRYKCIRKTNNTKTGNVACMGSIEHK